MKNSFSFIIILALALTLILIAVAYYLFSKINASEVTSSQGSSNDTLRSHGVTDLATKLSYLSQDETLQWPGDWQQLGTGSDQCQINNRHCQVSHEQCFDLSNQVKNKFQLPIDPVWGTSEKTGYVIRMANQKLEIRNCYAEAENSISQELRLN